MIETCELYPEVEMYSPMLVGKKPDNASELMASKQYIAMPKKDGYWYSLIKTKAGDTYLFSRSNSKKTGFYSEKIDNVPHIKEWAEQLPNDTILVGEIYYPGKTSKDTTTIMGCLSEKAVERQQGKYGWIHYYIHDIIRYAGTDYVRDEVNFEHRYSNLCEFIDIGCHNPDYIEIAPSKTGYDIEDTIYSWMEQDEEGGVLKLKSGLYLPGKRQPKQMFKIKQSEDSLDFVVTGFVEPEKIYTGKEIENWEYWIKENNYIEDEYGLGRYNHAIDIPVTKPYYYGWKVGFTLGLYDGDSIQEIGKVTSGLTDEMREDVAKNPDKYLGQVCEIQCMSVDKDKQSFRHPTFLKIRNDKPARDCTMESVFG